MIDFVKTLWTFVKERGYIKCERCGSCWTFSSFCDMDKEDRKRLVEGKGCKFCKNENWKDSEYLRSKKEMIK